MDILKPATKCRANNPVSCRYHAPFVALEKAVDKYDWTAYSEAVAKIEENERKGITEKSRQILSSSVVTQDELERIAPKLEAENKTYDRTLNNLRKQLREDPTTFSDDDSELFGLLISKVDEVERERRRETDPVKRVQLQFQKQSMIDSISGIARNAVSTGHGGLKLEDRKIENSLRHSLRLAEQYKQNEWVKERSGFSKAFSGKRSLEDIRTALKGDAKLKGTQILFDAYSNSFMDEDWGTYTAKL